MSLEETLVPIVNQALGSKYQNIRFFRQGGTRMCLLADWTPTEGLVEQRIIKVDIPPESPRAVRHVSRNYTTLNDARILLSIRNPEQHHLTRIYDVEQLQDHGWDGTLSVESYFPSESLEERVKRKPLDAKEFRTVFRQVLEGMKYLMEDNDLYHRDLKASNILVDEHLNVRITDFTNAQRRGMVSEKPLPTAGGHFVMDPKLIGKFTGNERKYDDQSEMYALGMTMLYALTGRNVAEYDPDTGIAVRTDTGASLLTDGKIDAEKHDFLMQNTLTKFIFTKNDPYAHIIRRATSLHDSMRYKDIGEMAKDFERACKGTFTERLGAKWKELTAATVMAGLLLGSAGLAWQNHNSLQELDRKTKQVIAEQSKYHVKSQFRGDTLEIKNNLLEMNITVHNMQRVRQELSHESYPESPFIKANPGEQLNLYINASEIPREQSRDKYEAIPTITGKAYFEGHQGEKFTVGAYPYDPTVLTDGFYHIPFGMPSVKVPKGEGLHVLAVELYAPGDKALNTIDMPPEGQVISRKRIPVIVGDPAQVVDMTKAAMLGYRHDIGFGHVHDKYQSVDPSITYEFRIPEIKHVERHGDDNMNSTQADYGISIKTAPGIKNATLEIIARREGEDILHTFLPIKQEMLGGTGWWTPTLPDDKFSDRIKRYRDSYERAR